VPQSRQTEAARFTEYLPATHLVQVSVVVEAVPEVETEPSRHLLQAFMPVELAK